MSVHYKFKSALEYDTVTFDGLHISVKDLKKAIIHQKRIGKNTDFDLQVTNAQTKEVYSDENALIPKNTSLVIARIPMVAQTKGKPWEGYGNQGPAGVGALRPEDGALSKAVDLTQLDASEDDKIRAMMTQSTLDYDPSNYMKIRGSNQVGVVPSHYRCFKCHQPGHWIKDCPLGHGQEPMEIKKSTGIPRSFMVPVEGPMVPGAMMTPTGQYAVPVLDHQAYNEGPKPVSAPTQEEKPEIPEDLVCNICKDLLTDAVMIPCCGNSFCDECIRTTLLESEDHECPDCHEKEISPGTLIPNRFLRNSVSNFKNETGYHKRITYRNAVQSQPKPMQEEGVLETKSPAQEPVVHPAESTTESQTAVVKQEEVIPDSQTADEPARTADSQKPVISEADSTETAKSLAAVVKEEIIQEKTPKTEGPPGVESPELKPSTSPKHPPHSDEEKRHRPKKGQAITSVGSQVNHHRVSRRTSSSHGSSSSRSQSTGLESSSRHLPQQPLPTYSESRLEERPGTPTVDEPGIGPPGYPGESGYSDTAPPGLHPATTTLPPSQHMHPPLLAPPNSSGPGQPPYSALPPGISSQQPPPGVYPAPNMPPAQGYRMPPPGHPDYNRLTGGGTFSDTHPLSRVLIVTNVDPSVPPPNVPPPNIQGFGPPPRQIFDPTRPPVSFDPHRPPVHGAPPPGYPPYSGGPRPRGAGYPPSRHMQPPPPGMNHRPPHNLLGIIDDPLEAFNRMLREKDERDRRARQARRVSRSRSYTRSRSRSRSSRSFSRSPRRRSRTPSPPRGRHRSRTRSPPPRRRPTRSRSRSFSISRSRSFSRSPSFRGSPPREYSPRRRPPSRYRSPLPRASPPRYNRYKENRPPLPDRDRDRLDRDRLDRDRIDRVDRSCDRILPDRCERDYPPYFEGGPPPDFEYGDGYDRGRQRPPHRPPRFTQPSSRKDYPNPEPFYQPPDLCPTAGYPSHTNRYSSTRGPPTYPPPLMSVKTVLPLLSERPESIPPRRYEDIGPPGLEQPPPPGFENPRYDARFSSYDRTRDDGPPGVDRYNRTSPFVEREEIDRPRETERPRDMERPRDVERQRDTDRSRDTDRTREPRESRSDASRDQRTRDQPTDRDRDRRYSPSPDHRHRSASPRRHSSKDRISNNEKARRKHESTDRDKRDAARTDRESERDKRDKKRDKDLSEDDKTKKSKDKKKKKAEKKEAERKKKKEKKEKKEQEKLKKAEEKKAKEASNDTNKTEEKKDEERKEVTVEGDKLKVDNREKVKLDTEKSSEQETKPKVDLYDDILTEGIDNNVVAQYGKIDSKSNEDNDNVPSFTPVKKEEKDETHKTDDDEEEKDASFDGIELQVSEAELKSDFIDPKPKSGEVLAPVPELSKWEREEEVHSSEKANNAENKAEMKQIFDRPNKVVTSEVLKRAENAIFAKAINAIRPIEIKKISLDRAKLYSGEKPPSEISIPKEPVKNIQITIPGPAWNMEMDIAPPGTEPVKLKSSDRKSSPPPNRLSIKERLGCKVEELDKISKEERPFERNRSRTLSPLSRRQDEASRNVGLGERRVEVDDGRRKDDHRRGDDRRHDRGRHDRDRRQRSRSREHKSSNYRDRHTTDRRRDDRRDDKRDEKKDERRDDRRDDKRDERRIDRSRSRTVNRRSERSHDRREEHHRDDRHKDRYREERERKDKEREKTKERDRKVLKRSRTRSRSASIDHRNKKDIHKKAKDKKHKNKEKESKEREKGKKHRDDSGSRPENVKVESKIIVQDRKSETHDSKSDKPTERAKAVEDRRKPTLDEANFEPDYDLDTESEKEDSKTKDKKRDRSRSTEVTNNTQDNPAKKKIKVEEDKESRKKSHPSSSSSESSDSSSDENKHKKKHRKHKKKKSKKDSSSSSSDSESDSSVEEKKKKRHKNRKQKKRKKSKHK